MRLRSDSTSPLAIRRPERSASANSASWAAGKCAPNTSAAVVPLRARPRTNARAADDPPPAGGAGGGGGQPPLLRQRAGREPVEQRHAHRADDGDLRVVDV